mmetsp:Transcript_24311/g.75036  ORF Transcript_24311/g.75036 Transcript_24311/m.75036 type:complete len:256 (-) Transcript_24311:1430-2197(-)
MTLSRERTGCWPSGLSTEPNGASSEETPGGRGERRRRRRRSRKSRKKERGKKREVVLLFSDDDDDRERQGTTTTTRRRRRKKRSDYSSSPKKTGGRLGGEGDEVAEAEAVAVEDVEFRLGEHVEELGGAGEAPGEGEAEEVDEELLRDGPGEDDEHDDGVDEDFGLQERKAVHDLPEGFGVGAGAAEAVPAGPERVEPVLEPGHGAEEEPRCSRLAADHAGEGVGVGGPVDEGRQVRREDVVRRLGFGFFLDEGF